MTTRDTADDPEVIWRKSSRSNAGNNCVEVARAASGVAIRDSKNPRHPHLTLSTAAFATFITDIKQRAACRLTCLFWLGVCGAR